MNIRCLLTKESDLYVAVSLDLGLAAQAYSKAEAISKLEAQINDYLEGILELNPKDFHRMLYRKGPLSWFINYYWLRIKSGFTHAPADNTCIMVTRDPTHA